MTDHIRELEGRVEVNQTRIMLVKVLRRGHEHCPHESTGHMNRSQRKQIMRKLYASLKLMS